MEQVNELDMRLLGTAVNLNTYTGHDSASRLQMFCSHITQNLVIEGATPKRIQTGAEDDYGKYTFKIEMPCNAIVIKVIHKYPMKVGVDIIRENPLVAVIYEDADTNEIGILMIEKYFSMHPVFGFKYQFNHQAIEQLSRGAYIPKGTVFAHSPNLKPDGTYCYGAETNVAYMSLPQVIEDGFIVRRGYLEKLAVQTIDERVIEFGSDYYPLNLYGDEENYKPFPEIGDRVRSDGLIMALRRYDEFSAFNEITPKDLLAENIDEVHDRLTYGTPDAVVYDVDSDMDFTLRVPTTPIGMERQALKYQSGGELFAQALLSEYFILKKKRGENLRLTPEFNRLLVDAKASERTKYDRNNQLARIRRMYRRKPLDNWRVTVKYARRTIPDLGWKISDGHGSKGVIVDIWEDSDMPTDQWGTIADVVMDGCSTVKRLNLGQLFEQYVNASGNMIQRHLRKMRQDKAPYSDRWNYLFNWYKAASPKMAELMERKFTDKTMREEHMSKVERDGTYIWCPPDSPNLGTQQVRDIEKLYPLEKGPVTFRGRSGNVSTTNDDIIIASKYMILLEAIPDKWSAVSTSKLQHFGIPALLSSTDKHSYPIREQPVKIFGEDEVRLLNATMGPVITADILDQSNNPTVHKEILKNLLRAEQPSNLPEVVDRGQFPTGKSRPLELVNHHLQCSGVELVYEEYQHDAD